MGQTYSTGVNDRNIPISEIAGLQDISPDKTLGLTRFLKTIRGKHGNGLVVLRQFVKPATPNTAISKHVRRLRDEVDALQNIPNVLPYQRIVDSERAVFVVRQYLYSTLYDRISTRPFLEQIEKRWIAFQLLCGLKECHARGIRHGDIKAENVLVTSWNWAYLSDFAPFKPTYLPEDNPADFSFFFETSSRRICYLAPERFLGPGEQNSGGLTDAMDIFSLGCVIAELFFEGTLFTLSQLFKYRKGEFDPSHMLEKIEDQDIKDLVKHMIQIDPSERLSAEEYLLQWRRRAFPDYFYSFLHQYLDGVIINKTPQRVIIDADDESPPHSTEADQRIERIYNDFDKISFSLGYKDDGDDTGGRWKHTEILPVNLDIPNYERTSPVAKRRKTMANDGTLIFLSIITSSVRNTYRAAVRIHACDLLLAMAERLPDESKLDRVLPYFIALLNDDSPLVRVAAIRGITQLMEIVEVVSRVNSNIFPEYILPKLQNLPYNPSPLVRATYAACLASLADSASRFQEMIQSLKPENSANPDADEIDDGKPGYHSLYDNSKSDLIIHFQDHSKALLTDSDSSVRRSFLRSVSRLCIFFGNQKANDIILSHLNTYLNDRDWILRCAFFETIISVATFVGGTSLEEYIMPLMVQALTDPEEFVIEKVIHSLTAMAELGLFQRTKLWELVDVVARFSVHPNVWVRESTAAFLVASAKWLSPVDIKCILLPLLRPYLRCTITEIDELTLLSYFKKPLSRSVFDMSVTWATKFDRGIFWKSAQGQRTFSFGSGFEQYSRVSVSKTQGKGSFKIPKNEEDEQWLSKLRNLGMTAEDEWKLYALREYVWRMAKIKQRHGDSTASSMNKIILLKDLDVKPHTVFFEGDGALPGMEQATISNNTVKAPGSLADALLDASKTIDSTLKRTGSRSTLRPMADGLARRSSSLDARPSSPLSILNVAPPLHSEGRSTNTSETRGVMLPPPAPSSLASSVVSDTPDLKRRAAQNTLSHKSSATALMSRNASAKAPPAQTSMNSANAVGQVELPFARDGRLEKTAEESEDGTKPKTRALHSYRGSDPYILKLLNSHCLENYPTEITDFGPIIVGLGRRQPIKQLGGKSFSQIWRPEGVVVAHFGEHTAAITRVVVAPDHSFFATASDDGTVKIWDAGRLEKNVATRARQTYRHGNGVKVRCLCFVENTYCFVSSGTDGSIHVVKVEFTQTQVASKYGKLKRIRTYQLNDGEYALWMEHFKAENMSILLVATNTCRLVAIDMRTMTTLYVLQNPEHHGTPTCFVLDKRRSWVLVGTTHGVLDLWDLRFRLRLKAWGLPGATEIHQLKLHPSKGRGKWVVVAGGTGHGEISSWDVEKGVCREVFRTSSGKDSGKGYEPWKVDDEKSEGILGRFASTPSHLVEPTASPAMDRGVRALAVGVDYPEETRESRNLNGFVITAGSDRKVHFWNLTHIESSLLVSGQDYELPKPVFSQTHFSPSLVLNIERIPLPSDTSSPARSGTPVNGGTAMRRTRTVGRTSRTTVISQQQQELLRSHLDAVLDVAVLEVPYGMIISVDRSGVIFVTR